MSNISNRFFVTALDDGTTLHGNLSVDGSLSQAWNDQTETAVPDWKTTGTTGTKEQPTIMLTLLSGATYIGLDNSSPNGYIQSYDWYYENSKITFESSQTTITYDTNKTVTGYKSTDGKFLKHTTTLNGVTVPALRIIQNLASSSNVDLDTIRLEGVYNSGNGTVDFASTAQIRISKFSSGGYLGTISFKNGISNITDASQSVEMTGTLYGSDTNNVVESYSTQWFLNGVSAGAEETGHKKTISAAQVVDNAIVRCDFYVTKDGSSQLVYSAYASIDDMQDTEYMYIQYGGENGNAASLRKGQTATFTMFVGTKESATADTSWTTWEVKLLDGNGTVITGSYEHLQPAVNGWRPIPQVGGVATLVITYGVVSTNGKNITGIVRATKGQQQS